MKRGYQHDYSRREDSVFDQVGRERKARTMVAVLRDFLGSLAHLFLLDVGASTGIIDNHLAGYFGSVVGIDIDEGAIAHAQATFSAGNLRFMVGDALRLEFAAASVDVVLCAHVYEHVPDAQRMIEEIFRVLKPGGVCYFACGNRLRYREPHYKLPFLSVIPRRLAHYYMKMAGKGSYYYEKHLSYWGLRALVRQFDWFDYTVKTVCDPRKFHTEYMLGPGSWKQRVALFLLKWFYWVSPGYLWILRKPE